MICASRHIGIGYGICGYVSSDGARGIGVSRSKTTGDVQVNADSDTESSHSVIGGLLSINLCYQVPPSPLQNSELSPFASSGTSVTQGSTECQLYS